MGKLKKDGIKNIYCSTCEKWMTEFYVSRHIHSKFHFTKKFFATEHLHKKQSQTKRVKKKQSGVNKSSNGKQKKITATVQSDYQQYKIKGGTIQNCSNVEDLDLRKATNIWPSTNLEVNNETPTLDMGLVSQDYLPVSQNCRTPENEEISALGNRVVNRYLLPRGGERYDMLIFFSNVRDRLRNYLQSRARQLGGIKWNLCVQVEMGRDDAHEVSISSPYFRSRTYITLSGEGLNEHDLNEALQKMFESLEKFMREGSGWYVKKVLKLEIQTIVYKPLRGSTYLPLPMSLSKSVSILNINNRDDKCFLYCLLASLHPVAKEPELVEHYYQFSNEVNMSGITYPVNLSQIRKVENQNESISINVFGYENQTVIPLRITDKYQRPHHVNLLWLTNEANSHYCLIKDLNRFLSRTKKDNNKLYFCCFCLHAFTKETLMQEHIKYCSRHEAQRIELPIKGYNDILEFKEFEKTLKVPFVIYADFETIVRKIHTCQPNPKSSASIPVTKLEVCGFGYKVVCEDEQYTKPSEIYRGEDAGKKLIECLLREEEEIQGILSNIQPMNITEEQQGLIENAVECCLCKVCLTTEDKKYNRVVRHHNHLTAEITLE